MKPEQGKSSEPGMVVLKRVGGILAAGEAKHGGQTYTDGRVDHREVEQHMLLQ